MKALAHSWRELVVGVFLIVGLTVAGARGAEPPKDPAPGTKPAPGAAAGDTKKDDPQVKTIALNHADLEEVRQVLGLLGYPAGGVTGTAPPPAPPGTPQNGAKPRIVVDSRTRTVFVRGADKDIEAISDVLAMLDAEPGKPVPEGKNLHLIPLRHAKVDEGIQLLGGLDLAAGVVPLRKANALLVTQAGNFRAVQEEKTLATVDQEARPHVVVGPAAPGRLAPAGALRIELGSREPEEIVPRLLEYAAGLHVSDVYFNTNEDDVEVSARHLGMLRTLTTLPAELGRRCVTYIKTMADMNISERRRPMDGRWLFGRDTGHRLDLRINTIPTLYGEDCTVRILDRQHRLLGLDQLGFDAQMYTHLLKYLHSPSGLLLVAGPTETGKSTTLYACLSYLNNGERRIHTIEDPIEYSIKGIRQSQVNAKIGLGFDELLRNVLRQAPDVILIGEIRDAETGLTAVRAASSGHMVLSTLHAPVGPVAIHTLLRLDILPHMLSHALLGVISQRLLRTLCPHCKVAFELPSEHVFDEIRPLLEPGEGEHLYGPKGCPQCRMTGYSSRTGVFEMVRITPELRTLIDERASAQRLREKAIEEGMVDFRRSALLKVARGETSIEEVVRVLPAEYLV